MATEGQRPVVAPLLMLNLAMYAVVCAIAGWAVNYSINESYDAGTASHISRYAAEAIENVFGIFIFSL